jgi:hypothetical protein
LAPVDVLVNWTVSGAMPFSGAPLKPACGWMIVHPWRTG